MYSVNPDVKYQITVCLIKQPPSVEVDRRSAGTLKARLVIKDPVQADVDWSPGDHVQNDLHPP